MKILTGQNSEEKLDCGKEMENKRKTSKNMKVSLENYERTLRFKELERHS